MTAPLSTLRKKRKKSRSRQKSIRKRIGDLLKKLKIERKRLSKQQQKTQNLRDAIEAAERMETSDAGVKFITEFEGFPNEGRPYNDPAGYATVGYGHLIRHDSVRANDRKDTWVAGQKKVGQLTEAEARKLLKTDLKLRYEPAVRKLFEHGGPLRGKFTRGRFDALVSFAFNLGPGSMQGVAGFETLTRAIQNGDTRGIADAFLLYNKAGGHTLPGLSRRRQAERKLFLTGKYDTTP